jgi:hypothetical protein
LTRTDDMVLGTSGKLPSVPILYDATRIVFRAATPTRHAHRTSIPLGAGF